MPNYTPPTMELNSNDQKLFDYYDSLIRKAREDYMDGRRDSAICHLGMAVGFTAILAKQFTEWMPRLEFLLKCYEFVKENPDDFQEDYTELVDEKIVDEYFSEGRVKKASATLTTEVP